MKTKIICIAVLLAGAAAGFSACDSLEKEKFPVENYSVNVDNYVTPGFVDIDAGASATLSLRVNSPFETTILKGPAYSVDALGSGVFGALRSYVRAGGSASRIPCLSVMWTGRNG